MTNARSFRPPPATVAGEPLSSQQIADIRETVELFPADSRHELAQTICEHLQLFTPSGGNRVQTGLAILEELERQGLLTLPAKRLEMQRAPVRPVHSARSDPQPPIDGPLSDLQPLGLVLCEGIEEGREWAEFVDRYHELGFRRPYGRNLRYFIVDRQGRRLGALLFETATRELPCREAWIGWSDEARKAGLALVVCNARFVLFPWVKVANLASAALALAARQMPVDWQARYQLRPLLMESFVDPARFRASSYRAANWLHVGDTAGHKGKSRKQLWLMPLTRNARIQLRDGPKAAADAAFAELWPSIVAATTALAQAHDQVWRKRRRVIDTLLVALFVFRLALAGPRQGYDAVLAGLWEQCRRLNIKLPQPKPVAASAMTNARAKVDEQLFRHIHAAILEQANWRGDGQPRILAVDGCKMNLPSKLKADGFRPHATGAHYPQGLVSCLYELEQRLPIDVELHAHCNERRAAAGHLDKLAAGDIIIYDRGYYSYAMLREQLGRGLHPVFRIARNSAAAFDSFMDGNAHDRIIELEPGREVRRLWQKANPGDSCHPVRLRLAEFKAGDTTMTLATSLLDSQAFPVARLAAMYKKRWRIEELYKTGKGLVNLDRFHSRSLRGVKQEIYAAFTLILALRLFANHHEGCVNCDQADQGRPLKVNLQAGLQRFSRELEALLLSSADNIRQAARRVAEAMGVGQRRLRPNRSEPRRSLSPANKWSARRRT